MSPTLVGCGVGAGFGRAKKPWDPTLIASLFADWDAARGVSLSTLQVTGWTDQINAKTLSQGTDGNRPSLEATGWSNGLPQIKFNSAQSDTLSKSGGLGVGAGNNQTILAVYDQVGDVGTEGASFLVNDISGLNMTSNCRGAGKVAVYDGTAWRDLANAIQGEQLIVWELDAAQSQCRARRNGVQIGTGTYDGTWVWTGAVSIGSVHGFPNIEIARILCCNAILSAGDLAYLEDGLMALYDL